MEATRSITRADRTVFGDSVDLIAQIRDEQDHPATIGQNDSKEPQANINIRFEKGICPSQFCDVVSFSGNAEILLCF